MEKISHPSWISIGNTSRIIFFLVLNFAGYISLAQEFGGNPPSIKWRQVNSQLSRIIFPEGLDSQALELDALVKRLSIITGDKLGEQSRKINIVLQNQPTYSNGYVALGPFRSEFYLTPRQNSFELGSLPWHKKLLLHEYRHVQQFSNFRKGVSKLSYYLFGEEGQALANSIAIPDWFWEGDAVYQETVLSTQGRGRIPYFFNDFRSLWSASKNYSWMKLRNGSYRDLVPDHYQLGYLLVNYGNLKYGPGVWKNVTSDAAAFKGVFYPFQKAFRRYTNQSFSSFRKEALSYYCQYDTLREAPDSASAFARKKRHFSGDELYPRWTNGNEIVYLKSSYSRIPAFYKRNFVTGAEIRIRNKGVSTSNYFSANRNHIVYSSYVPHPRWSWRNFEVITVVDIQTGRERRITPRGRYLSPSISDDGATVVAVHSDVDGSNALHLIEVSSGNKLHELPVSSKFIYTYPVFYGVDTIVTAVRNAVGEMALGKFSITTGQPTWVTPFSMNVIAFPSVHKDTVFFSQTHGNQDKLFAAAGGTIFQVTPTPENRSTGNYLLTASNGKYAWSTFTWAGYKIYAGSVGLKSPAIADSSVFPMVTPPVRADLISPITPALGKVEKYSQGYRLLNFHSWRPYFNDPEYSYSIVSNNILNTLFSEVYFTYNRNERFKETGALVSYAALFPVISGGASFTFDRSFTDTAKRITWNEFNARLGASVPLQFTRGAFSQSLNFGAAFNTKQVYYTGASKEMFDTKKFNYGELTFSVSNQQQRARQQIFPRYAQTISSRYRRIINNYTAQQLLLNANLFLPGLHRTHSIVLQGSYQSRDTLQQYVFPNSFPFSRGYPDIDYPRMWKAGINYHLPLLYPDWGFANIVYLLRVRGNVFYDFSRVKSLRTGRSLDLDASGTEIYFDTRWWNQLPVSFGIRYSRLFDAGLLGISPNRWELVLPMNLFSR